MKKNNLSAICT